MIIEKLFSQFAASPAGCEKSFLTLHTWYHYLPTNDFNKGCDVIKFTLFPVGGVKSDVPLVLAAVIDDLLQIAGLVALGFVIVGAIKYIGSQGSPDATASAQGTVINALIGLAIAITGVVFVNFIGNTLGK
ncbi:MAG TPA: hypothetical protein VLG27_04220 [Candidatus Saccharimonadia bacterium]|nr:hypothetical protein [Candidatus Saccharimonadia bacterium]